jgi:hypothetical protein
MQRRNDRSCCGTVDNVLRIWNLDSGDPQLVVFDGSAINWVLPPIVKVPDPEHVIDGAAAASVVPSLHPSMLNRHSPAPPEFSV